MVNELEIRLFGGMRIALGGIPLAKFMSNKVPALLAYLAVIGRAARRDDLAALLWGEMPDTDARNNLRQALADLRRALGPYLIITRETVALNAEAVGTLDIVAFEHAINSDPAFSPEARAAQLGAAVTLYAGDFLAGFFVRDAPAFEEWMLAQRARYRELVVQALHAVIQLHIDLGRYDRAIRDATHLLSLDEWREEAHRQLMLALARTGQRSAALAQYKRCCRALRQEFDIEPSVETIALYERIKTSLARPRHNLPAVRSDLIGREAEMSALRRRLAAPTCRLLTLIGPYGAGKTQLALETARGMLDGFLDGVWVVQLTQVVSFAGLIRAIADALGVIVDDTTRLEPQLLNYLERKELLLVLDHFEHLVSPPALDLVCSILRRAPSVKLLITSRVRLNLTAEWLHDISGLSCRTGGAALGVVGCPAVQLFVQRAQRVRSDFALTAENSAAVAHICRMTGGLPLAIELAAAWVRTLTPVEIVAKLARGLSVLTSSAYDAPEYYRSLPGVFEPAWVPLESREGALGINAMSSLGG